MINQGITKKPMFIVPILAFVLTVAISVLQLIAPIIGQMLTIKAADTSTTWNLVGSAPNVAEIETKGLDIRMEHKGVLINISMSCQNGVTQMRADVDSKPITDPDGSWPIYGNPCMPEVFAGWWKTFKPQIEEILGKDLTKELEKSF